MRPDQKFALVINDMYKICKSSIKISRNEKRNKMSHLVIQREKISTKN